MLTLALLVCTAFLKDLHMKTNLFIKHISGKQVILLINCCLYQGLDLWYETRKHLSILLNYLNGKKMKNHWRNNTLTTSRDYTWHDESSLSQWCSIVNRTFKALHFKRINYMLPCFFLSGKKEISNETLIN